MIPKNNAIKAVIPIFDKELNKLENVEYLKKTMYFLKLL